MKSISISGLLRLILFILLICSVLVFCLASGKRRIVIETEKESKCKKECYENITPDQLTSIRIVQLI